MAITTMAPHPPHTTQHRPNPHSHTLSWLLLLPLLTAATLLVNGYHPLAEDGGVYVAGVEYLLDPALFPHYTPFVTAHLHYSLFAPAIASLVHLTHLPLSSVLLLAYIFSLWLLLYAGFQLLRRCTRNCTAQLSGVGLLGVWSTLPIAGTSLMLTDPCLTARSFTTPLSLFAIAYALDNWRPSAPVGKALTSPLLCAASLLCAALLHPLMAFCALCLVVLLRLVRRPRALLWCSAFAALAVLIADIIRIFAPQDSPPVIAASMSRYYWFLSQWQWYELCGLLGPLAILLILLQRQRDNATRHLCRACLAAGGTAILLALLFAHAHSTSHLIARLQPLRIFLLIYAIMTVLLGATVTERLLLKHRRAALLPLAAITLSGVVLFLAQRSTYPASQHIELPWAAPINPWSQAFIWIRSHTPPDTLFALDPDYITTPGEDAQTFRATAQRSALPDFSKDGGEASITPSLTSVWQQALAAQSAIQSGTHLTTPHSLSTQNDAERDEHLQPLGVAWLVLLSNARTAHPCPYDNGTVKVCRLTL